MAVSGLLRATIAIALLGVLPLPAFPESDAAQIQSEYRAVAARLAPLVDGEFLKEDPAAPDLLARSWALAGEWLVAWLDARGGSTPDELKAALAHLTGREAGNCVQLGPDTWLVTMPGTLGHAFVVTKASNGRHKLAWSTAVPPHAGSAEAKVLGPWLPATTRYDQRRIVYPRIGRLPDDAMRRARFYLDGAYSQYAGATVGAQISVWSWDGKAPRVLITRNYVFMIEQAVGMRVKGDFLIVQQKKEFRSFFACGGCEGRQTDWKVQLTPDGVRDLGEQSVVPELDAVDALFDHVMNGRPAEGLAAPEALRMAQRLVAEAQGLGMIDDWKVTPQGADRLLCLSLDGTGAQLYLLRPKQGSLVVETITPAMDGCKP